MNTYDWYTRVNATSFSGFLDLLSIEWKLDMQLSEEMSLPGHARSNTSCIVKAEETSA